MFCIDSNLKGFLYLHRFYYNIFILLRQVIVASSYVYYATQVTQYRKLVSNETINIKIIN
jgi:hypothetical protein